MIHNGIVVNADPELWAAHGELTRTSEVDTEVLAALAGKRIEDGSHPITAIQSVFDEVKGTASVALVHNRGHWLMLATNTGDLYRYADEGHGFLLFASERFILSQVVAASIAPFQADPLRIAWLRPGFGAVVDLRAFKGFDFLSRRSRAARCRPCRNPRRNRSPTGMSPSSSPQRRSFTRPMRTNPFCGTTRPGYARCGAARAASCPRPSPLSSTMNRGCATTAATTGPAYSRTGRRASSSSCSSTARGTDRRTPSWPSAAAGTAVTACT
ncbi:MAG: hypothetical protein IPI61_10155 [Syntrophaceae bacterium]|nr:hypothetical protein [Syntrophaceae bacterium]